MIAIIAVLAGMALVTLASVQQTAKESRAKAQVARIHELLAREWESFQTARIEVHPLYVQRLTAGYRYTSASSYGAVRVPERQLMARARVDAVRELMRMTLPDRKSDLTWRNTVLRDAPTAFWNYRRRAERLSQKKVLPVGKGTVGRITRTNLITDHGDWEERLIKWSDAYAGAECLYLILSNIVDNGRPALEFFSETEIGDFDADGMPEILDPWGQPVTFLRWAPGFQIVGGIQDTETPDPFDPLGLYADDPATPEPEDGSFALFPLVFSAGPDRLYEIAVDIRFESDADTSARLEYVRTSPPNNPFVRSGGLRLGHWTDANGDGVNNSLDNIHNHILAVN